MNNRREMMIRQIGAKLAYYRTVKKMSQTDLAKAANISPSTLSRIERGDYNDHLSIDMLFILAETMDVEPMEFLRFSDADKNMW